MSANDRSNIIYRTSMSSNRLWNLKKLAYWMKLSRNSSMPLLVTKSMYLQVCALARFTFVFALLNLSSVQKVQSRSVQHLWMCLCCCLPVLGLGALLRDKGDEGRSLELLKKVSASFITSQDSTSTSTQLQTQANYACLPWIFRRRIRFQGRQTSRL